MNPLFIKAKNTVVMYLLPNVKAQSFLNALLFLLLLFKWG